MSGKHKRSDLFEAYLNHNERILWMGQPQAWRILGLSDLFLIPFSIFWLGFALMWVTGFGSGNPIWFFGILHVVVGLYMLFGRFIHKYLRWRGMYYAVTNQRVLWLNRSFWRQALQSRFINTLPMLDLKGGWGGTSTIIFEPPATTSRNQTSRQQMLGEADGLGFYNITDAAEIYHLIQQIRAEYDVIAEKAKNHLVMPDEDYDQGYAAKRKVR
jgi:hypothetical protein